jgi:flagellar export protein FliJ
MTPFRFRLEKVLEWRRRELEREDHGFKREVAALAEMDRRHAELEATGVRAEIQVREWSPLAGSDLAALGSFRVRVKQQEKALAAARADQEKQAEAQRLVMLEARRRCRLLERLRERRLAEWEKARDREIEELASESCLARRVNRRGR